MKPPLPPELVRLGDELERDVRERVVDAPRRRQLVLGILATFVITVPMAISITSAELTRPVSELGDEAAPQTSYSSPPPFTQRPVDELLPRNLRQISLSAIPTPYPTEPTPLRPALR